MAGAAFQISTTSSSVNTRSRLALLLDLLVPITGLTSAMPSPIAQPKNADRVLRPRSAATGPLSLAMLRSSAATVARSIFFSGSLWRGFQNFRK